MHERTNRYCRDVIEVKLRRTCVIRRFNLPLLDLLEEAVVVGPPLLTGMCSKVTSASAETGTKVGASGAGVMIEADGLSEAVTLTSIESTQIEVRAKGKLRARLLELGESREV